MPVRVNGELLDDALVEEEARRLRPHLAAAMRDAGRQELEQRLRDWSRDNVIERVLLRQAALADREPIPPNEIEAALAGHSDAPPGESGCRTGVLTPEAELNLRVDRLVARHAGRIGDVRHKDIVAYYRAHREEFEIPELVHAAHIVKHTPEDGDPAPALEAIQAVEAELQAGTPFEELARRHSDCPDGDGDLGWFPRGQMVDEFDEVVFNLPAGQVSPIFRTTFGFHIARVIGRKPAHPAALEEVEAGIRERLAEEKRKRALDRFLDHLRARAVIETLE
jgi:parvulin-like peptidyl-prolyl isomerase